jgi:acetoacetyl-CoA reductase
VNNAGYTWDNVIQKMSDEQWYAIMDVHMTAPFRVLRAAQPVIRALSRAEQEAGREVMRKVVNISSIAGLGGNAGQVNYSAAKAGDIGFTKALALENAKGGITVNVICPGYINTEMVQAVPKDVLDKNILPQIPVNRLGEPEEIARSVVFLAADDAGFITGSTLTVNGGQYHA